MGVWKLMLPVAGTTMIEYIAETVLPVCSRVILVAGYRARELMPLADRFESVKIVINHQWELGMFSSIHAGVQHVETERFFICLADLPLIRDSVFARLLEEPKTDVVVPVFRGRRGHPVLLGSNVVRRIKVEDPAIGNMREIIREFSVRELDWNDDSILRDTDTPEEFRQVAERLGDGG